MRGQALVLALLVILSLSIMGLGLAYVVQVEYWLAVTHVRMSAVDYAAQSGLEFAAAMLTLDKNYRGGVMPVSMSSRAPVFVGDVEITVGEPAVVDQKKRIFQDANGDYVGKVVETTYRVWSTAVTTNAQIVRTVEANICVPEGGRTEIGEWKQIR